MVVFTTASSEEQEEMLFYSVEFVVSRGGKWVEFQRGEGGRIAEGMRMQSWSKLQL